MDSARPEPIAIVGSGCRFPGGATSPSALWDLLSNPHDVLRDITQDRFNTKGYYHPDGTHHGTTNVQQAYLLQEDVRLFDATFFNISPNEADSMDPQQRLLLETVYEALESGGHTIEALRGSDTAVYVGTMGVDYNDLLLRDLDTIPTYFATGTNRAIISNRVSYFFDWHGPSLTLDTACSSKVFIYESKLKMLSPTGRSRMWDADADGYARGEGVAAIILKRLSDAIADGDHIECLIRQTGANQDGYSSGLTVPSSEAQSALIHQTYAKAGLDLRNPRDRPQFFEAHGTGTQTGDPKEAAAIHECFGQFRSKSDPLIVGSVKTVIGHTEGAAGLAGLLKGSEMIQKGFVPPNLLFNQLNPAIETYYHGLHVPTALESWPKLAEGIPRRVSVNSFGFGGSNAHAILEEYFSNPSRTRVASTDPKIEAHEKAFYPFVFSAVSEASLAAQLQVYSDFLKDHEDINAFDLAWTLRSRRSHFAVKVAFSAATVEGLISKINTKIEEARTSSGTGIGIRSNIKPLNSRVLGVFTGQGAQWAAMGGHLIRSSGFVRKRIQDLEKSLATLPPLDRPQWHVKDELLASADTSRTSEAEISQPLCTAIQVVLVDLLQAAGITFSAVVGHSSGEIGAAYAAGLISDHDAIRIAYYRGLHVRLAGDSTDGQNGAMLAVGTSLEDAQDLIQLRRFRGRLAIAAHNSSASVTLSGDADAILLAKKVFDEEKIFARLLKVDKAYHSHHMLPCGEPYIQSLRACGVRVNRSQSKSPCSWYSSVAPSDRAVEPHEGLQDVYWKENMTSAVLFADAVRNAVASDPQLHLALEVGPHPALKGPATQNISEMRSAVLPYCGLLSREKNDIEIFSDALGFMWSHLGAQSFDLQSYAETIAAPSSGDAPQPTLVVGLPSYQWSHEKAYWHESRKSRKIRGREQASHELLGVLSPYSTARDLRWTNVLKVSEIPWLTGHQLQGQMVFPASGYVAMALEAARYLAADRPVELFEIHNLSILKAITFEEDDKSGVETLITLTAVSTLESQDHFNKEQNITITSADFSCYSSLSADSEQEMELIASGTIKIVFGTPGAAALSSSPLEVSNLSVINTERFYSSLLKLGYGYSGSFRGLSSLQRKLGQSSALVATYKYTDTDNTIYLVHPTTLDVAFQASMLAYSAPGDERLWSLHVPTSIGTIRVNPAQCICLPLSGSQVPICATLDESEFILGSIELFGQDGQQAMIQVEDLTVKPFAPASKVDDRRLFSYTRWDLATPDGTSITRGIRPSSDEVEMASVCERISYHYLRKWKSEITDLEWTNSQQHYLCLRDFMNHKLSSAPNRQRPSMKRRWTEDNREDVKALIERYPDNIDVRLLSAVGENIPAAVRGQTTILEHMLPNNMLDDFYKDGLGFARYNMFLANMVKQTTHRYPHARILEIGAGTGGATKSILESIENTMSSYTYTDISAGFFERAAELFKAYEGRMIFKVLDVEKIPSTQGFELHSYDLVIASNVLHATASLQRTLENTRQLLKPGGYLMLLEITNNGPTRFSSIMGGLPGWWLGVNDGRKFAPTITPGEWHTALRKAGFSGVDAITPEIDGSTWPFSIVAAQAVDDQVNFLRRPLARSSSLTAVYIESLVILGTGSLQSARLAEELEEHLERFCGQITILDGLPTESEGLSLNPMSTFINLVDIDTPTFKSMTAGRMDGLKRLFDLAKHVLWITQGAQADEPYHMASIAFSRALSHEAPHITLNRLDISDIEHNTSRIIAEYLLTQSALDEWESSPDRKPHQQLLWSKEPEVFVDRGQLMIPRLMDHVEQNDRLNSSRRVITKKVPISSSDVSIVLSADSSPSLVEQVIPKPFGEDGSSIKAESSSLMALYAGADTYLFLSLGQDEITGDTVLALSETNSNRVRPVERVKVDARNDGQFADALLLAAASELLAIGLVETLSTGSSLLVHCSGNDRFIAAALSRRSAAKDIPITYTCEADSTDNTRDPTWIQLSSRAPRHTLRRLLFPVKASHLLDLTAYPRAQRSDSSLDMAQILPSGYKQIDLSRLSRHSSLMPLSYCRDALVGRLQDALVAARAAVSSTTQQRVQDLVIRLDQIDDPSVANRTVSVVQWPLDGDVTVGVRPLDARSLFSHDKTYLLVGLTGEIGRSICEWMISNGAGCVCLTSRSPSIDETWLDSFRHIHANVKVFAMDVTSKQSLKKVIQEIKASCPPIAGVINGAMVLHDSLFSRMSLEAMQKVLGPKIDGTNNLDELFYDDDLDFFILFSSSVGVMGNSGQANYAATSGYLNSLSRQRRKRGVAASTVDIGRVAGIGYVETAGQAVVDQLTKMGLMAISETEFHQILAETIQAGLPILQDESSMPDAVVTTGIRTVRDDEEVKGPMFDESRFSHCIVETRSADSTAKQQDIKTVLPAREQVSKAVTMEQVFGILQECLSAKLRVILQLSDLAIDHDKPMVELGVDSLVAVEVRSWFMKELKVDVPVLKVVGGASLAELCQLALDKLPNESLTAIGKEAVHEPVAVHKLAEPEHTPDNTSSPEGTSSPNEGSVSNTLTDSSSESSSSEHTWQSAESITRPTPPKTAAAKRFLKTVPIAFGQSRFWFLRQLLEDQTTSNVAFYYGVTGQLRVADLERAIRIVTARHEALRTCFIEHETEADQAYQKVMSSSPLRLEYKQIQSMEDLSKEYAGLRKHVFDLANGEMIRLVLLSLSSSSHYLLVNCHHILMDGVSVQVFLSDLEKAYNGQYLGSPPRQFPDFSRAQRQAYEEGEFSDELKYWQRVFPAGEEPTVLPLLPMARTSSRVAMNDFDTHQVRSRLEPRLLAQIKAVSKSQRSTPFHFHLAAFKAMLFCFTDASDLTIGIADANRTDSDVMGSIGFFLNLLTLRFRRHADQRFADSLLEARDKSYAALGNSRLPFDILLKELNVSRSSSHSPFFQAFLDYRQGTQEKQTWADCQLELLEMNPGRTAYDITLDVTDNAMDSLIMVRVQKSLYDLTAAKLLLETYIHFVETLSSDVSLCFKTIPMFGEKQLNHAVELGRGPTLVSDWPVTLPHRIDQVIQHNPHKIALMDDISSNMTYSDLSNRIEAMGEALRDVGIGAASRVLVFQQAASDWICSMLAIMRVGGIYVPMDLRNPMPRLAAVALDCEPQAILADETTMDSVTQLNVLNAHVINVSHVGRKPSTCVPNCAQPDSPAAILYTSGSTGLPKGIAVTHSGLRNEIEGYTKTWKLGAERTLQQSAYTFNHSSDQIYTGLVNGGMVYTVPWSKRGDPLEITKILQEHSITYTKATPSEYSLWMQYGGDNLQKASQWRRAFGGGEPLNGIILQDFEKMGLPQLRVFNSYGPTEISISSTKKEIEYRDKQAQELGRIPCGYSLPNYATYILDEQLKPLPAGMPGEIYLGGAGVSLGYLNNVELTSKHFVPDPFASPEYLANGWTRMYRTGDIGHLQDDGAMVFHNRIAGDTQIKIRGLRIELADIEGNIVSAAKGALREVIVTLREGNPNFLIAHVVFAPQQNIVNKEAFLEHLLTRLPVPQYMIPVAAIPLDKLPLTNHSKVDRKALKNMPLPQRARSTRDDGELTETMVQLRRLWQDVLGLEELAYDISSSTSFFSVGGNSLLIIRLQSRIRQVLNVVVRLVELLDADTLGKMARKVEESPSVGLIDWDEETAPPSIPSFLDSGTYPVQEGPKNVLVTGGTGFLAKYILPQLTSNPDIGTIHCVAVRDKAGEAARKLPVSSKVICHSGDLSKPLLGLSEDEFRDLSRHVDVILHMGAIRSFFDSYHVLRPSNVHPTKELVKLAAPRRIPIHYISTIGVLPRGTEADAVSAAAHVPPVDGTEGYIATRWTSERILERSAASLGLQVSIYRFLPSAQQHATPQRELDELVRFVDMLGTVPDFSAWDGRLDMLPATQASNWVCESILSARYADQLTRFSHLESSVTVDISELEAYIGQERGGRELERVPGPRWVGMVKRAGFEYFFTSLETTVEDRTTDGRRGARFESRR